MPNPATDTLSIPIAPRVPQFEADSRSYRGLNAATYIVLGLCYDSLAAPGYVRAGTDALPGAVAPDYSRMQPRLAESFERVTDLTWSLCLRPGVVSHARHELTAEDVRWAFEKIFSLGTTGAYRWSQIAGLSDETHIEVVDRHRLLFHLRAPNPNLPAFFFCGVPQIVDAAALREQASPDDPWAGTWLAEGNVAGYGPYSIAEYAPGHLALEPRNDYWGKGQPVPSIQVSTVVSRTEAFDQFATGDATYLLGLRADEARRLGARDDVTLVGSWGAHIYLGMNYNRPPFDDVRVRRALSLATPYVDILEKGFLGYARPWRSPLATFDQWYNPAYWDYATNLSEARRLLSSAGLGDGLALTLHIPSRPDYIRVSEILRDSYNEVGVDLDVRDMGSLPSGYHPTFYLRVECGHNFNEAVYDLAHDYAPIHPILAGPRSGGGVDSWLGSYPGSPGREEMYRNILLATSDERRKSLVMDLQREIADEAPVIFIAEVPQISAAAAGVAEFVSDFDSRVVQALQFQNCNTGYLP